MPAKTSGSAQAGAAQATSGDKPGAVQTVRPADVKRWEVNVSDVRLAKTFERWARESGELGTKYRVLWDADKHVLIDSTTSYTGTFLDAVEAALRSPSILYGSYPLEACLYSNDPPLLRITKQGEQAKDCPTYR